MTEEVRLKTTGATTYQQQVPVNSAPTALPGNQNPTPVPTHYPTMVYGIGQMLGGGAPQPVSPQTPIITTVQASPVTQFPPLQPKVNNDLAEHLPSILQLTSQLNSMNMSSPSNLQYRNTNGGNDNNIITSSLMPLKEKMIKNTGKKKLNNQLVADASNTIRPNQQFNIQTNSPLSEIVAKNPNYNLQTPPVPNSQQTVVNQNTIPLSPPAQSNQLPNQQLNKQQLNIPNQGLNKNLRQSNFSNDDESAPQYLPDDFTQQPSLNINPSPVSLPIPVPTSTETSVQPTLANIQTISNDVSAVNNNTPITINTPPVNNISPVIPPQSIGRVSNVSNTSNMLANQAGQAWAYIPHNANYDYNKQLKVSNVSAISQFNSSIPNAPGNNTFTSTATMANYAPIVSNIPSNIQNSPSNTPTQNNAFQNTKSYYIPQNQQKPSQQSQLNIQQQQQQQQKSNLPQPQYSQQPNYANGSFAGYAPIASNIPSYLNDVNADKSRYTMQPLNSNPPSYMNVKNPFQNQYK